MIAALKRMAIQMRSAEWEEAAELGLSHEAISVDVLEFVIITLVNAVWLHCP